MSVCLSMNLLSVSVIIIFSKLVFSESCVAPSKIKLKPINELSQESDIGQSRLIYKILQRFRVGAFFKRRIFAEMETPCWCLSDRYQYGGRKVTETAVIEFLS